MLLSIALAAGCASSTSSKRPAAAAAPSPATSSLTHQPDPATSSPPPLEGQEPVSPGEPDCFHTPVRIDRFGFRPKPMDEAEEEELNHCPPASPQLECDYAKARAYFEHNRFELAAPIFRRVALDPAAGERGVVAAQLMLESMNVLLAKAEPPRRSCVTAMGSDTRQLRALYCSTRNTARADFCRWLRAIEADIERLSALELVRQADDGAPNAPTLYRQAGERYMRVFDELCQGGQPRDPPFPRCDVLIYNALMAFRAGGAKDRAAAARAALLDPKHKLNNSELARKVAGESPTETTRGSDGRP